MTANCHQEVQHPRVTKQSDIKGNAFLWSHKVFCQTPADRFSFDFVRTHSNDMTSIRFICLNPHGLLAGATPKQSVSQKQIQLRAFQTSHVIWPRMPFCPGPAITAFCNLYKHDSDVAFNNGLKTNDINDNIQNHDSKMMMILQKWK